VLVPARLRHGSSWSDACILNVSSRGLMIHTGRPISNGTTVEIRRGDYVIIAQVVWREGGRAGLRAEERVPIDELIALGQSSSFQLTAAIGDRRKHTRPEKHRRLRDRAIEFAGVILIAVVLAGAARSMIGTAVARPLAVMSTVLGQ
jgi:hypothetical protein